MRDGENTKRAVIRGQHFMFVILQRRLLIVQRISYSPFLQRERSTSRIQVGERQERMRKNEKGTRGFEAELNRI